MKRSGNNNNRCTHCDINRAQLKRPKDGSMICRTCFYELFENEVHRTITEHSLFTRGERVVIAASGGKDSTVLAYIMKLLNDRHDYGLDLVLLSVDEGITGYRDDSLETVKRNRDQYQIPLTIVSYEELYDGWTMDEIVRQVGLRNNCSFCGVFRRQALDRGCMMLGVDKMVTGHNADDIAETVLMNILRGDYKRLTRCLSIVTGEADEDGGNVVVSGSVPRAKPFKYTYEKEIVMYAYFKKLDYFSTECVYSPNAYRGFARALIKDLERIRPQTILDIIRSGENFVFESEAVTGSMKEAEKQSSVMNCERCGYISSQKICRACVFLEGLNKGRAKLSIFTDNGRLRNNKLKKHGGDEFVNEENGAEESGTPPVLGAEKAPLRVSNVQSINDLDF